jgi:hypothetical protein
MTCKIKVLDGLQMEDVTGTTIYVVENSRRAHGWFGIPPNMSPARLWRHETTERDAVEFSSQVKYVAKLYEPGEHEEAAEDEDSTLRRSSVATAIAPYRHSLPSVPRPRTRRLQRESRHPVLCARCVEWRRRRQGEGGGGDSPGSEAAEEREKALRGHQSRNIPIRSRPIMLLVLGLTARLINGPKSVSRRVNFLARLGPGPRYPA